MKKLGIFALGLVAGIFGTRFCMTNPKAQEFFAKARKRGEDFLGKKDEQQPEAEEKPEEKKEEKE